MSSPVVWSLIGIGAFHVLNTVLSHLYVYCSTRKRPILYIADDDECCPLCGTDLAEPSPLDELRDTLNEEVEPETPVEESAEFKELLGYKS
jgi:hypothetical protein